MPSRRSVATIATCALAAAYCYALRMEQQGPALHIAFVGRSGSGKTTLIERVVPALAALGLTVAVVKHTHHQVEMDSPGKDTWRFRAAGAAAVALVTPERLYIQSAAGTAWAEALLSEHDLVLHEGSRASKHAKVLVGESLEEARARGTEGGVLAVVGPPSGELRHFRRDDVGAIAQLLHDAVRDSRAATSTFDSLVAAAAKAHGHLCPGQVLGVRMAVRGVAELGLSLPPAPKRLLVFVENDRCAADAVGSVTGTSLGRRSLRFADYGKMAATLVDLETKRAVRVAARDDARERVLAYAPGIDDVAAAQTAAYRRMPDEELLRVQEVVVALSADELPGVARARAPCDLCGEDVAEARLVRNGGSVLCQACAGEAYYRPL